MLLDPPLAVPPAVVGSVAAGVVLGWCGLRLLAQTASPLRRLCLVAALTGSALLAALFSRGAVGAAFAGLLAGAYVHGQLLAHLRQSITDRNT